MPLRNSKEKAKYNFKYNNTAKYLKDLLKEQEKSVKKCHEAAFSQALHQEY